MEEIKPANNKIYYLLQPAVDYATFIGSGLLACSYSTIWVNDPTTKSGIVLAGLLNATAATALEVANYCTKEEPPLYYKVVFTIVVLAATAFATPYLAILLKDRFATILTREIALQIGGLNLATKALTYALYLFASRITIPTTSQEIENLSSSKCKECYDFFQTEKGKIKWKNQSEEIQLSFLKTFYKNDLPYFSSLPLHSLPNLQNIDEINALTPVKANWHKRLTSNVDKWNLLSKKLQYALNEKFVACNITPWPVHLTNDDLTNFNYDFFQTDKGKDAWKNESKDSRMAYLNAFFQSDLPFFACNDEDIKEMSISKTSDDIKNLTKNQATWLYNNLLLCIEPVVTLPKEISQACVDLFYRNGLSPLPKIETKL